MNCNCGKMHSLKDMTLILKAFLESPSSISPLANDFASRGHKIKQMDEGPSLIIKRKVNGPNGMVRTAPRLLDAEKNEVNYSVGNGSKVRVQFNEYHGENKYGPYTGLDLQAVQVLDLVEYRAEDGAELLDGEEF
jgi:hypothetical protein